MTYHFAGPLPGDFNGDGRVDAADYVTWRNDEGTELDLPNRKPEASGTIGSEDYQYWVENFGNAAPANGSAAIFTAFPEPASLVLLVGVLMPVVANRRWRGVHERRSDQIARAHARSAAPTGWTQQ